MKNLLSFVVCVLVSLAFIGSAEAQVKPPVANGPHTCWQFDANIKPEGGFWGICAPGGKYIAKATKEEFDALKKASEERGNDLQKQIDDLKKAQGGPGVSQDTIDKLQVQIDTLTGKQSENAAGIALLNSQMKGVLDDVAAMKTVVDCSYEGGVYNKTTGGCDPQVNVEVVKKLVIDMRNDQEKNQPAIDCVKQGLVYDPDTDSCTEQPKGGSGRDGVDGTRFAFLMGAGFTGIGGLPKPIASLDLSGGGLAELINASEENNGMNLYLAGNGHLLLSPLDGYTLTWQANVGLGGKVGRTGDDTVKFRPEFGLIGGGVGVHDAVVNYIGLGPYLSMGVGLPGGLVLKGTGSVQTGQFFKGGEGREQIFTLGVSLTYELYKGNHPARTESNVASAK